MKILHIITTADIGGAENQLLILTETQVSEGNDVSIIYLKGKGELKSKFVNKGIRVIDNLSNKPINLQIKMLRSFIKENWHVIHTHLPRAEILTHIAYKYESTLICSRHFGGNFFPKMGPIMSRMLSRAFTRKVDSVIAISDTVKEYLIESGEIKNRPIEVVNYAFSKSKFLQNYKPKDLPTAQPIIGVVSRLSKEKRVGLAIEIFNNFLTVSPYCKLLICGEGSELPNLKKLVRIRGLEGKVEFLGKQTDIQEYYSNFDILLHTSEFEGFGMVYLEAMSFNLPIVYMSKSGFISSIGECFGLKFLPDNHDTSETNNIILEALNYNRKEIETTYSAILEKYSTKEMEAKISSIYRSILQRAF